MTYFRGMLPICHEASGCWRREMVETRICTPERLRRSGVAGASAAGVGGFGVAKGRALCFLVGVISSETRGTILNPPVGIFISHSSLVMTAF